MPPRKPSKRAGLYSIQAPANEEEARAALKEEALKVETQRPGQEIKTVFDDTKALVRTILLKSYPDLTFLPAAVETAEAELPPDSEAGFAVALYRTLKAAEASLLFEDQRQGWSNGFSVGFNLARVYSQWREEFELGPLIGPALTSLPGKEAGGRQTAANNRKVALRKRAEWARLDEELLKLDPAAPKAKRAAMIARSLKGSDLWGASSVIRRALK